MGRHDLLRSLKALRRNLGHFPFGFKPRRRDEVHEYWRSRGAGESEIDENAPSTYTQETARSEFLVHLVEKHATPESRILEIGCNVGRNLHFLHEAGFGNLTGIEINPNAVQLMKETYPDTARDARVMVGAIEDLIVDLPTDGFDVVFTMAVLIHIHTESEWIFKEMRRVSRNLVITVEDEVNLGGRHFPRNYKKIFEGMGMREVESHLEGVPGLESCYVARVFG